jgi:hypothetical protein
VVSLFFVSLLRLDRCWQVCVLTVGDVQPEIRPEVTGKIRKSFENPRITRHGGQAPDVTDRERLPRQTDLAKAES